MAEALRRWALSSSVRLREEDFVLFNEASGEVLLTNAIGFAFVLHFSEPQDMAFALASLSARFGQPAARLEADFVDFCTALIDGGFFVES